MLKLRRLAKIYILILITLAPVVAFVVWKYFEIFKLAGDLKK